MSELHRFLFEGVAVRGALVRITDGWQELLSRRAGSEGGAYPAPVQSLLGEMTAAALLMQSSIKFNGALILQIQGDGPVKLAVAEVQPDLAFRCTANVRGDVAERASLRDLVNLHGAGRCAITLDPKDRQPGQQPYQGVVPIGGLSGASADGASASHSRWTLADALAQYMAQSEQLETRFVLAANEHAACGLMIQRMPTQGVHNLGEAQAASAEEDFNRIAILAASLTRDELLNLPSLDVLHRLFWDEKLLRHEPQDGTGATTAPHFACTCSRERVTRMIETLGAEEAHDIIADKSVIDVGCDFCGQHYKFDAVDVGRIFTAAHRQMPCSRRAH